VFCRHSVLASLAAALAAAHVAAFQSTAKPQTQQAAPPVAQDGAISGFVVDGSTGAAVSDAIVAVALRSPTPLPPGYQSRQVTDAKGRFAFLNLPNEGSFQITVIKFGYLDGGYGRDTAPNDQLRPIAIANGSWVGNLRVPIWRPGVISGTVRDEGGEPQVGVLVRALARIRVAGRDELAAGPLAMTDDFGRYRLSGLLPGRYIIQVPSPQMSMPSGTRFGAVTGNAPEGAIDVDDTARLAIGSYPLPPPRLSGRVMAYGVAFHPAAQGPAQAATIDLQYGDNRQGVDVSLMPVPAFRLSGVVEGPAEALVNLTLRLLPAGMENLGLGAEAATALVGADGAFTFINVPAGSYTLDAPVTFNEFSVSSGATIGGGTVGSRGGATLPSPPPRMGASRSTQETMAAPGVGLSMSDFRGVFGAKVPNYTARLPVTVGSDIAGMAVKLRPGVSLRGRISVEVDPAKPLQKPPTFFAFMDPAGGEPGLGQPGARGSIAADTDFEIPGLMAGEYFFRVQPNSGFQVKSILWRGRDYTLTPFDAAANDDLSGVQVVVTNAIPALTGTARGADGTVPEQGIVVVFPADSERWVGTGLWSPRLASTAVQNNGTYRLEMPAGDYLIAAIARTHTRTWRDPAFLRRLERQATRVTLGWGQTVTRDLTLSEIK
jgi:hypothetical protein